MDQRGVKKSRCAAVEPEEAKGEETPTGVTSTRP
jgi:hypothetical protein